MNNERIGSNFDDFLAEEGLLGQARAAAVKWVIARRIEESMKENGLTKSALARRMGTSRASLNRLLDPDHPSVTLLTLEKAASALGLKLRISLE